MKRVTERGIPRWRIEAIADHADVIDRLRRDGRVHPSRPDPAPWPVDEPSAYTPDEVVRLFAHSRGEH